MFEKRGELLDSRVRTEFTHDVNTWHGEEDPRI